MFFKERIDVAILFVASGLTIQALPTGDLAVQTLAGDGHNVHRDGTGTGARLVFPRDVVYDPDTDYYYFSSEYAIRRMNTTTLEVETIAGGGTSGSTDHTTGTSASFGVINSLAVHPTGGYLLVTDGTNQKVRKVLLTGTHEVSTIAGNGNTGYVNGDGNVAEFQTPSGIDISSDGNTAIVTEEAGCRVRSIDLTTNPVGVALLAGHGNASPTCAHTDDTGGAARFDLPRGVQFFGGDSAVLVADVSNNRIRHITVPGGVVTTYCGDGGQATTDGTCAGGGQFNEPGFLHVNSDSSEIYVSEYNDVVRRITVSPTLRVDFVAGIAGTPGYNDGPAAGALFNEPLGLTSSPDESTLLVVDYNNHRLREIYLIPTNSPTSVPTSPEAQHIYIHAVDLHGDGWGGEIYLRVQRGDDDDDNPEIYTLGCACKVVRVFSSTGDMTISLLGVDDPNYWWEALFTIGYSDGYSAEPYYVVGGVNSTFVLDDWQLETVTGDLLYDAHDIQPNLCTHPSPKPKSKSKSKSKPKSSSINVRGKSKPKPKPDTRVELTLTIGDDLAQSWCDDSYNLHDVTCSAEHRLSPDARLPNILAYPRYYISEANNHTLVKFGTLRNNTVAESTTVKLDDDESYVFSVSGHYLHDSGNVTWEFCGEEGGLGERLHFDIVNGVCVPDFIETIPTLSCENEWSSSMDLPLASDQVHIHASKELLQTRYSIHVYTVFGFLFAAIAVVLLLIPVGRKLWKEHVDEEWVEHLEQEWENVKKELPVFDCIADDDDEEYEDDEEDEDAEYDGDNDEQDVEAVLVQMVKEDEENCARESENPASRRTKKAKTDIKKNVQQQRQTKKVVSYRRLDDPEHREWRSIKHIYDQDPCYEDEAY